MVVGDFPTTVDVLVVGGGPGGYVAALRTASAGLSTVLVERTYLGGTCLNVGCIPSKALLHAAALAASGADAASWGIDLEVSVDLERVQNRIDGIIARLTRGVGHLLEEASIELRSGTATFISPTRARVVDGCGSATTIEFRQAIIATGSRAVGLGELPFDGKRIISSAELVTTRSVPESLVVVGGGYIGVELGTAFAKLGSKVTIVEREPTVLSMLDRVLVSVATSSLGRQGIEVATSATVLGIDDQHLVIRTADGERRLPADVVLVAVGRRPNTDGIGLEQIGIATTTDGLVKVDASRRGSRAACAIGDITAGPSLAHKAMAEAEVAARTTAGKPAAFDPSCIPMVVFSDPEIASVGLTEPEANRGGLRTETFRFPLTASGRAMVAGDTAGCVQVVVDGDSGVVVGAQLAGPNASELAFPIALALEMGATARDVAMTIAPHPSMTEALVEAAWMADGMPLHISSKVGPTGVR